MTRELTLTPAPVVLGQAIYPCYLSGEEPLVKDLDLAEWLEFERPHEIRRLIKRHASSLGPIFRYGNEKSSSDGNPAKRGRGRPGQDLYLNERQVLRLCAKSEASKAEAVLDLMIEVFMAARRGLLVPAPAPAAEALKVQEQLVALKVQQEDMRAQIALLQQQQAVRCPEEMELQCIGGEKAWIIRERIRAMVGRLDDLYQGKRNRHDLWDRVDGRARKAGQHERVLPWEVLPLDRHHRVVQELGQVEREVSRLITGRAKSLRR